MYIARREPAMLLALLSSIVMLGFSNILTSAQQGAINAVAAAVVGLITNWAVVKDGGLALIVGLLKAVIALGIAFGLKWDPQQQAMAMTLATTAAQFFVRTQVTPSVQAFNKATVGTS
jgi:hypothetical protein